MKYVEGFFTFLNNTGLPLGAKGRLHFTCVWEMLYVSKMRRQSNGCTILHQRKRFLRWNLAWNCNWLPWVAIEYHEWIFTEYNITMVWPSKNNWKSLVNVESLMLVIRRALKAWKVSYDLTTDKNDWKSLITNHN